jgi:hypothetical protein
MVVVAADVAVIAAAETEAIAAIAGKSAVR